MTAPTLLILPGDGIGPEVMAEVRKVIAWFGRHGRAFAVEEDLVGGCAYDAHGVPLTERRWPGPRPPTRCCSARSAGRKYDALDFALKPERGLLRLRKELDLFANLRPAQCFDALADFSSLKRELVEGLDILIVRELTGGVYFGEPRGIVDLRATASASASTPRSTPTAEIARVARGRLRARPQARRTSVCSMEKANVMEVGRALAPGRHRGARRRISRRRAQPHVRRRRRDAARPLARSSSTSSSPTTSSATCSPTSPRC